MTCLRWFLRWMDESGFRPFDGAVMFHAAAILLGLSGCSTAVSPVTIADGRQGFEFRCGGFLGTKPSCNLKASEVCPRGYVPIESSGERLVAVCATAPVLSKSQEWDRP